MGKGAQGLPADEKGDRGAAHVSNQSYQKSPPETEEESRPHTEHATRQKQQRRRVKKIIASRPVDSFIDLKVGDYVVHVAHGIAKFTGVQTIAKDGKLTLVENDPGELVVIAEPGIDMNGTDLGDGAPGFAEHLRALELAWPAPDFDIPTEQARVGSSGRVA